MTLIMSHIISMRSTIIRFAKFFAEKIDNSNGFACGKLVNLKLDILNQIGEELQENKDLGWDHSEYMNRIHTFITEYKTSDVLTAHQEECCRAGDFLSEGTKTIVTKYMNAIDEKCDSQDIDTCKYQLFIKLVPVFDKWNVAGGAGYFTNMKKLAEKLPETRDCEVPPHTTIDLFYHQIKRGVLALQPSEIGILLNLIENVDQYGNVER